MTRAAGFALAASLALGAGCTPRAPEAGSPGPSAPAAEAGSSAAIAGVDVVCDRAIPARVSASLLEIVRVYAAALGTRPGALELRLVHEARSMGYEYDCFDHGSGVIWMLWDPSDPDTSEWTLAHELAHAFQFALEPAAYEHEPSWVHEGWAEELVGRFYADQDPERARQFLERQAGRVLADSGAWRAILRDVYRFDWSEAYPACHLAVHHLIRERGGLERFRAYFRARGAEEPASGLREVYGIGPGELAAEVLALAKRVTGDAATGR